jgi:hypothetical protein
MSPIAELIEADEAAADTEVSKAIQDAICGLGADMRKAARGVDR